MSRDKRKCCNTTDAAKRARAVCTPEKPIRRSDAVLLKTMFARIVPWPEVEQPKSELAPVGLFRVTRVIANPTSAVGTPLASSDLDPYYARVALLAAQLAKDLELTPKVKELKLRNARNLHKEHEWNACVRIGMVNHRSNGLWPHRDVRHMNSDRMNVGTEEFPIVAPPQFWDGVLGTTPNGYITRLQVKAKQLRAPWKKTDVFGYLQCLDVLTLWGYDLVDGSLFKELADSNVRILKLVNCVLRPWIASAHLPGTVRQLEFTNCKLPADVFRTEWPGLQGSKLARMHVGYCLMNEPGPAFAASLPPTLRTLTISNSISPQLIAKNPVMRTKGHQHIHLRCGGHMHPEKVLPLFAANKACKVLYGDMASLPYAA